MHLMRNIAFYAIVDLLRVYEVADVPPFKFDETWRSAVFRTAFLKRTGLRRLFDTAQQRETLVIKVLTARILATKSRGI